MKRYKFEVIVEEENDEFWEELTKTGFSGADQITDELRDALTEFYKNEVKLVEYTDA